MAGIVLMVLGGVIIGVEWLSTTTEASLYGDSTVTDSGSEAAVVLGAVVAGVGPLLSLVAVIAHAARLGITAAYGG